MVSAAVGVGLCALLAATGSASRPSPSALRIVSLRGSVVKYYGSTLAWRLAALAVDALGDAGLAYEPHDDVAEDDEATGWYADYMYDLGLIIGGGSSNIQKNIIAERGLGMPREPKLQGTGA